MEVIKYNYILTLAFFLFAISMVSGQVVIGDGLTISEGTTMTVKNQDVIINTDKIAGEGKLSISHDIKQIITVTEPLETAVDLDIIAEDKLILGEEKQSFALQFLPPLTQEIILAKKESQAVNSLPIRYINFEGKSFEVETDENQEQEVVFELDIHDTTTHFVVVDVLQVKGTTFNLYYILPIYSFLLNNERFSDYAELYEFKCLTALDKPPIV